MFTSAHEAPLRYDSEMTATTRSAEDGTPDPGNESSQTNAPVTDAPDGLLVGTASPDRCVECGAEMAVDQRYCVECGNRRGPARFALQRPSKTSTAVVPVTAASSRPPALTLAATGIVIALLALGVGVLIGHDGKAKTVKVTVTGPSVASPGSATGSSSGTAKGGSKSGGTSTAPAKNNFFGS